jgi:hypothetical protein
MWSIWFYFMPNATAFEAVGFESEDVAVIAITEQTWFQDEGGNNILINNTLKQTAVIKICKT